MTANLNLPYVIIVLAVAIVALFSMADEDKSFSITGNAALDRCIDSDPTNDYYIRGEVTRGNKNEVDTCSYDNKKVSQYYCSSGIRISKTKSYRCPYGCENGACIAPQANCGNNLLENGELCDDGNTINGDGCDSQCIPETGFVCHVTSVCDK